MFQIEAAPGKNDDQLATLIGFANVAEMTTALNSWEN
jgi:hypothetical protein